MHNLRGSEAALRASEPASHSCEARIAREAREAPKSWLAPSLSYQAGVSVIYDPELTSEQKKK